MRVDRLTAENFRNLHSPDISPCDGINVIWGENGQGKTNLIECIWLFTGCRSFRSVKDRDVVGFGCERAAMKLDFFASGREQQAKMTVDVRRQIELNGIQLNSGRRMMGRFTAVVFTPLHMAIIKEGPEERRRFMDIAISQLKPGYAKTYLEYQRALLQRNAALKSCRVSPSMKDMLFVWEKELADKGAAIIYERLSYLDKLTERACPIYSRIASGREELTLKYQEYVREKCSSPEEIRQSLIKALEEKRETDIERSFTSVGPHRESFSVSLAGVSARLFGSQGQQRTAALALKLAEAQIITDITGEEPVVLLDDVFSELDSLRRKYILNHFENRQVFITCCDADKLGGIPAGKLFEVKDGKIL